MIRNVLDHRHEAVRSPMGEAIAVDGSGLHLLRRSYFTAIDKQKEADCVLSPEEGESFQDAVAEQPGELPPPLYKPLKIYPTFSELK